MVLVCWAFILTCLYLAISPWLSFVVHVAQSKAITEYKIQTLRNERLVFEEKQAMESVRSVALDLEQKNIDSEVAIKETKEVANESDDKKRYLELITIFSEEKIRNMFSQLESGTIGYSTYNSISELCDKLQSIEYHFENELLENSRINYAEKIQMLVNFLKNNTEVNTNGYSVAAMGASYIVGIRDIIIPAYRAFFAAGRSLPRIEN